MDGEEKIKRVKRGLGILMRNFRRDAGLSQVEFTEMVGRTQSWMTRVENGSRTLHPDTLAMMADLFDCEISEVIRKGERLVAEHDEIQEAARRIRARVKDGECPSSGDVQ
jgi:transcriptional regulator with XRE-family HTH domain